MECAGDISTAEQIPRNACMPTHVPTEPPRLEQEPGDTTFLCRRQLKFEVSGTVLW